MLRLAGKAASTNWNAHRGGPNAGNADGRPTFQIENQRIRVRTAADDRGFFYRFRLTQLATQAAKLVLRSVYPHPVILGVDGYSSPIVTTLSVVRP